MPAGSAAVVAHKRAQNRRKKLEAKAKAAEDELEKYFAKFDDSHTGRMNRDEMRALLTDVKRNLLDDPSAEVDDQLFEKIEQKFDLSGDGDIERSEVLPAVKRYKALLVHNTKLRELFDKHDADKSGGLQPDQLLALLTDVAESDSKHRYKHAEEADVEFVMGRCDKEGDGVISFDELGPAIATWKEAARNVAPEPSSACVLL